MYIYIYIYVYTYIYIHTYTYCSSYRHFRRPAQAERPQNPPQHAHARPPRNFTLRYLGLGGQRLAGEAEPPLGIYFESQRQVERFVVPYLRGAS